MYNHTKHSAKQTKKALDEEQQLQKVFEDDFGREFGVGMQRLNLLNLQHRNNNNNNNSSHNASTNSMAFPSNITPTSSSGFDSSGGEISPAEQLLQHHWNNLNNMNGLNTFTLLQNTLHNHPLNPFTPLTPNNTGPAGSSAYYNFPPMLKVENHVNNIFNNLQNQANAAGMAKIEEQVVESPDLVVKPKMQLQVERKESKAAVAAKKKRASKRQSVAAAATTNTADENRWKSWSRIEEVFLTGAVMDRFFKRGSLSSTRGEESGGADDCWGYIKDLYDRAWANHTRRSGEEIPTERSMNALSRHYKVMKARIAEIKEGAEGDDFRAYFEEWEHKYNVGNCLYATGESASLGGKRRLAGGGMSDGKRRASVKSQKTRESYSSSRDSTGRGYGEVEEYNE